MMQQRYKKTAPSSKERTAHRTSSIAACIAVALLLWAWNSPFLPTSGHIKGRKLLRDPQLLCSSGHKAALSAGGNFQLHCVAANESLQKSAGTENVVLKEADVKYHVLTVCDGNIYHQWQVQVHYYTYLKAKADCDKELGAHCEMGGFTRLLTTGEADDFVDEIPTFVTQIWPSSADYKPLNRAFAYMQWLEQATVPEQFVLFTETDTLFLRPVPNLVKSDMRLVSNPVSFYNFSKPELRSTMARYMPGGRMTDAQAAQLPAHGNSPVMMTMQQFKRVVPHWHRLNVDMYNDTATREQFSWMLEMYSFTLAIVWAGVGQPRLLPELVALPPYDPKLAADNGQPYFFAHYAYPMRFNKNGTLYDAGDDWFAPADGWNFYKAEWHEQPIPRNLPAVPANVKDELVRYIGSLLNDATRNIPCWDKYADNGQYPEVCDEVIPGSVYPRHQKPSMAQ